MHKLNIIDYEQLSNGAIKALAQNHIKTTLDFLEEDVEKLSILTNLNVTQILAIRNKIFSNYSAPLINGASFFLESCVNTRVIRTGLTSLDDLLQGGIPIGYITELCGLADSGKTQLCLQIAINCVKHTENVVLFINTKGDFSAVRIQKILDSCGYSHKEMAIIMLKIKVVNIWSLEELIELLRRLKRKEILIQNLSILIIDSLPSLMFQFLGDSSKIGLNFLNNVVNYCRFLNKTCNLAIICVNIQTRWIEQDICEVEDDTRASEYKEPYKEKRMRCMGKYWQQIPAVILQIEKNRSNEESNGSQIKVTALKSVHCQYDQHCYLRISSLGVT